MNVLITGAGGQLGNEIRLASRKSRHRYVFADIVGDPGCGMLALDVTDADSVRRFVSEHDIDVLVNCAAYNDVNGAESDAERCRLLNAKAPENLAVAMKESGGLLIHVSTDYVFGYDGYDTPYDEDRPGAPESVYGMTKLEGERAVAAVGGHYLIIRTSWLYSSFGKNFVKTMLELTARRPCVSVVSDQVGTPTYARDLAEVIFDIVEDGKAEGNDGIYHYSNEGECSWYDFARTVAEYAGRKDCVIYPCSSEEYPSAAKRPTYSVLDKSRIKAVFGVKVPYWKDSLKECLNNILG